MCTFAEGGFTVKIDKVSELVVQSKENTALWEAKSYDKMYYVTYGPFIVGEYTCEVRASQRQGYLYFFLVFLENTRALKKCGFISLLQDHSSSGIWTIHSYSTKLNDEINFRFGRPEIKVSGLPTLILGYVANNEMQKYTKADCLVAKFVVWVLLDDSKLGSAKPAQQLDQKANQPNNSPPDYIGTLLVGQFTDVDFLVKDQTFSAHRAILAARSSVFQSELRALQDETCCKRLHITVQHIDALTFKYMLHFIYTNSLPPDFEATTRGYYLIFIAAHRFNIEGLKSICEEKLSKAATDSIIITLELNESGQELNLLKIVPKECHMKQEIITTTTSVRKALLGDRVYSNSDD